MKNKKKAAPPKKERTKRPRGYNWNQGTDPFRDRALYERMGDGSYRTLPTSSDNN